MQNKYHVQLQDGSFITSISSSAHTCRIGGAQYYSYQTARAVAASFKAQGAKLVKIVYDGSQTFPYSFI